MSEVLAWLVEGIGPVTTRQVAETWEAYLYAVTPLVAAPPEGAPSWRELANALRLYGRHTARCRAHADLEPTSCDCGWTDTRALLTRIPKEEG